MLQVHKSEISFPVGADFWESKMKKSKPLSVNLAAKKIGVAPSTIYGMIARGELHVQKTVITLDPSEVRHTPKRGRGRVPSLPASLRGKKFAELIDGGWAAPAVARRFHVSRQAVSEAVLRYRRASGEA